MEIIVFHIWLISHFLFQKNSHDRMLHHPEVNWTEIIRQSIAKNLDKIEEIDEISSAELRVVLNQDVSEITTKDLQFAEKMSQIRDED